MIKKKEKVEILIQKAYMKTSNIEPKKHILCEQIGSGVMTNCGRYLNKTEFKIVTGAKKEGEKRLLICHPCQYAYNK